jgi:hypothetical protein
MADAIILDPAPLATGRAELNINSGSIAVREDGPDWGEAAIQAYLADLDRGSAAVDFRIPNRDIKIPLALGADSPDGFAAADRALQAKVALIQREGGWLKRTYADGRVGYLDLVNASLIKPDRYSHQKAETDITLSLEAIPDFYGDEITLDLITETSATELVAKLKQGGVDAVIKGDYPGRCRIVITDLQGISQLGLLWGFRSKHYDPAPTAALAYQAEALTPLDTAATAALAGASGSGSNTIRHNNLGTDWTPVLNTNLLAGTFLTHVGTYRMIARARSTSAAGTVKVRSVYDVGDLAFPVENTEITVPAASQFFLLDLGELRLDKVPVGAHRWQGQIQAKGANGGENIAIDKIEFWPVEESSGKLRAPQMIVPGLAALVARDEFSQSAGALTGKTASVGGAWAGAGDADDFAVESTGHTLQRTAVSDVDANTGRYAISGAAALASQFSQVDHMTTALGSISSGDRIVGGALARYVDINNWAMATFAPNSLGFVSPYSGITVRKRVAGTVTTIATIPFTQFAANKLYTIRFQITADGKWTVWAGPQGGALQYLASGFDTDFATGGVLASGKPGIYDHRVGAGAATRTYDNFQAGPPPLDAVVFASQPAELRTDGMFRKDTAGTAYGPVTEVAGDLPRIPPSGAENRPVELFIKGSRGDFDQLPDTGIDDISAQVIYRPSWLLSAGV